MKNQKIEIKVSNNTNIEDIITMIDAVLENSNNIEEENTKLRTNNDEISAGLDIVNDMLKNHILVNDLRFKLLESSSNEVDKQDDEDLEFDILENERAAADVAISDSSKNIEESIDSLEEKIKAEA